MFKGAMARRSPSIVRVGRPIWNQSTRHAQGVSGLSGSAQAAVARVELARFWTGMVVGSLSGWALLAHGSARYLNPENTATRCGIPECGCDPGLHRDALEEAICALPRDAARELRTAVRRLDDEVLSRAPPVSAPSMDRPWWRDKF